MSTREIILNDLFNLDNLNNALSLFCQKQINLTKRCFNPSFIFLKDNNITINGKLEENNEYITLDVCKNDQKISKIILRKNNIAFQN